MVTYCIVGVESNVKSLQRNQLSLIAEYDQDSAKTSQEHRYVSVLCACSSLGIMFWARVLPLLL